MIIIKTEHETIHKTEIQAITIGKETIPTLPTGIITVTSILNIDTEATHQSIEDKSINYTQLKKQIQTPQVSVTQKITNYN